MTLTFFVAGEPRPKQSFRIGGAGNGGHGFTPARVKAWQESVGFQAKQEMNAWGFVGPMQTKLAITLTFQLGDLRRVDLDNLSKGTLDAMNGIVYADDQQVVVLHLAKQAPCKEPGVRIQIEFYDEDE